jgi:hypothetical protein
MTATELPIRARLCGQLPSPRRNLPRHHGAACQRIGHGREKMIRRYTHLRPDFMQDNLPECPILLLKLDQELLCLTLFDPKLQAVA